MRTGIPANGYSAPAKIWSMWFATKTNSFLFRQIRFTANPIRCSRVARAFRTTRDSSNLHLRNQWENKGNGEFVRCVVVFPVGVTTGRRCGLNGPHCFQKSSQKRCKNKGFSPNPLYIKCNHGTRLLAQCGTGFLGSGLLGSLPRLHPRGILEETSRDLL